MADRLPDPDALLPRPQAAAALVRAGYEITKGGLAAHACRGTGPPYRRFGRSALYQWSTTLAWAQKRAGPPATSAAAHRMLSREDKLRLAAAEVAGGPARFCAQARVVLH